MSHIEKHIEKLLYLYDCVIIPGFGGFIGNYTPANLDQRTGEVTPPHKTVLFNKQLNHDDGLLTHWICTQENIEFTLAQKRIKHFREEINASLYRREKVTFPAVGTFHFDRNHKLIFTPTRHNFLAETMGMETIRISPLPKRKPEKNIAPVVVTTPPVPYVEGSTTIVGRLLKYGLSAAAITGIIIISQLDIFKTSATGTAAINSMPRTNTTTIHQPAIISPDCDFVDYDLWE